MDVRVYYIYHMKPAQKIRILTLNAGLLDVEIFGKPFIEPAPYINERIRELPRAIKRTRADLVAFQEVYNQPHREFLISQLKTSHPYHFYLREQRPFRLEDSLIIFSKFPILKREVVPFRQSTTEEELFAFKGVMRIVVRVGSRTIIFYNAHTTAGGVRDPQDPVIESIRAMQIRQIGKLISHERERGVTVLAGDFNAGPQASAGNYALFENMKLADATLLSRPKLPAPAVTWDPKNFLNRGGPHRTCPPQRIDHVFLREKDLSRIAGIRAHIVFSKPTVSVGGKRRATISDHYGLLAEILLK